MRPEERTEARVRWAAGFAVHVGVDAGKTAHQWVSCGPDRQRGHHGQTFAAFLRQWGATLVTVSAVVTKRLKEIEDNSPRKDDAKDAGQVCRLVGQGLFVETAVLAPLVAELRVLTTERHRLAVEQVRLANRLQAALDLAWPEFAARFPRLSQKTPRALLAQWPVAADGAAAPFRALSRVMREVSQGHHTADDARALTTAPQVGSLCAATLVAELGTPEGFSDPRQVLKLAGMNLARRTSGTSLQGRVRQTKRGRPLLRRQLFLLAGRWCQPDGLLRADYEAMVARNGGRKIAAICAMARRLVPLLLRIAQTGEPWSEARWRRGRHASASLDHAA
jgi:transposase